MMFSGVNASLERETGRAADRLLFRRGRDWREPPAWIGLPPQPRLGAAPIVAVHGITRNAEEIARRLAPRAAAQGRMLIAPLFSEKAYRRYQRAVCPNRSDHALLDLLDALAEDGVLHPGPVDLVGFSGGAQFAHRFAWIYPHRVARLTVASAGWWTFPDAAPFPYGLGPAIKGPSEAPRWLRASLADFLDREITVAVGARDCVKDAQTRSGAMIDAQQGSDRLTRAQRWVQALRIAAERQGVEPRVHLQILAGCGHDFTACADAGLDRLMAPDARHAQETLQ